MTLRTQTPIPQAMVGGRGRPARRRQQLLGYVRDAIAGDGVAPSYGMIASALGMYSRHEVYRIVTRLEKDGLLERAGCGTVRRIRLLHTHGDLSAAV